MLKKFLVEIEGEKVIGLLKKFFRCAYYFIKFIL